MNLKRKHFTLVEIMIVVAIIGLLAAIGIPSFIKARENTRKNACINNLRMIDSAKQQFVMENDKSSNYDVQNADVIPYIKGQAMPKCPSTGKSSSYTVGSASADPTCENGESNGHKLPNAGG